ncbi:hypothetical protein F5148DRAFT_1275811 [Russula earlei]|uniref:Uncharacterized protein n=1 Tax=Russula earlei TaxID=71964 RepID=A0ACC0U9B4_9AGAM|nr:hypothetical protein F5148DRAFT_1275811 [Russula earlei]
MTVTRSDRRRRKRRASSSSAEAAAIALKEDLGFEGFTIYEKARDGVGGVWRGCGSDIPGHWYSLSRAPNPRWKALYAGQPEIRAYWEALWATRGLRAHTRFGTEVVSATWDARAQTYAVVLEEVLGDDAPEAEAPSPRVPEDLPDAETFRGDKWHSAAWRHDVPLAGKRVGVIGNGCSAAQFVPAISEDASVEVVNFCRSPQWYLERSQFEYPEWVKWVFAHVPFAMAAYRAFLMGTTDFNYLVFSRSDSLFQRLSRKKMTEYIKMKAPKRYHSQLIPQYPPGCKRVIVDPGYLECLHRANVTLSYDAIERIVPQGVQLKTGQVVPLDVLIFGTGFSLLPPRLEIFGIGGVRLSDYWESKGGPEAYYGLAVPSFPNFFMLLGPNSAGGHASVIFNEEVQIQHAMQLIRPILEGEVQSFAVREDVSAKYNSWIQKRLVRTVWNFCDSYYRREATSGKVFVHFPGPVSLFWWLARKPRYSDYVIVGGERWQRMRSIRQTRLILIVMTVVGLSLSLSLHHWR